MPLKCTMWSGSSAIQTSDSQAISSENLRNFFLSSNAETITISALHSFSFSLIFMTRISPI